MDWYQDGCPNEVVHDNTLTEHHDIFAWSHKEIPGIDNAIIEHHLCVNPDTRKVRQKRMSFSVEKMATISEEVDRLMAAGFIQEAQYLEWLSNVVLVNNPNGN